MDQARWLIVLSVVFFMFVTLAFLNRAYKPEIANDEITETAVSGNGVKTSEVMRSQANAGVRIRNYGQISYPKPPAHVFVIESRSEVAQQEEKIRTDGKIISQ